MEWGLAPLPECPPLYLPPPFVKKGYLIETHKEKRSTNEIHSCYRSGNHRVVSGARRFGDIHGPFEVPSEEDCIFFIVTDGPLFPLVNP